MLFVCAAAAAAQGDEEIAAKARILQDPAAAADEKKLATATLLGAFGAGKEAALEPIKAVLQGDDSAESQANMVPVLNVFENDGIRAGLLEMVLAKLSSGNPAIRNAAFNALASPANISSNQATLYEKMVAMAQEAEQADFARISAARLIGKIGNPDAVPVLLDILNSEPGLKTEVRIEMARALGELKDLDAVEPLIAMIDAANKDFSRVVVDVLVQITYHNYGLEKEKWVKFWQEKNSQHKPITREKLLEDFIRNLQGDLASSVLEELKAQNLDKIIEILDYSGGNINPPSKYGKRYPELVDAAVRQLLTIKMTDEKFPAVIVKLDQLLLYDNEAVKKTVLSYFATPSARQGMESVPALLARHRDKLESAEIRSLALGALKNVVNIVAGGDSSRLATEVLDPLENAMIEALNGDHKTRMDAVDILGFGLRSRDALVPLATLLQFKDAPDGSEEARQFRVKICQNMHQILVSNDRPPLPEEMGLSLTLILGRSFLKDDHIRHVAALPLADIDYEKPLELEGSSYEGATTLLGSLLKPGGPRNVIEGVLIALEQIKSAKSEQAVLDALADDKTIPRNDPAENSLAVTALNTLKGIGGNASLGRIAKEWIGTEILPARAAAWDAAAACADRLLQAGRYDALLSYRDALAAAPQEAGGTRARTAQDLALKALADADLALKAGQKRVSEELVPKLDPENEQENQKARKAIKEMAARNPSLRLILAEALNPSSALSAEIKTEAHNLLVEITGAQVPQNDYEKWKEWLQKNP